MRDLSQDRFINSPITRLRRVGALANCKQCGRPAGKSKMCPSCLTQLVSAFDPSSVAHPKEPAKIAMQRGVASGKNYSKGFNPDKLSFIGVVFYTLVILALFGLLRSCFNAVYDGESSDTISGLTDVNARLQCHAAITQKAIYGSKTDFSFWVEVYRDAGITYVLGSVEFMNAFGAMMPYEYRCRFDGTTLMNASVNPK